MACPWWEELPAAPALAMVVGLIRPVSLIAAAPRACRLLPGGVEQRFARPGPGAAPPTVPQTLEVALPMAYLWWDELPAAPAFAMLESLMRPASLIAAALRACRLVPGEVAQ
mmetsp:Transcript_37034/g.86219  ORF Transcript_37034/g.86219 Transcript_37034/m.86219 type:complete len:112 (+) Transcript_37034:586-921(+)